MAHYAFWLVLIPSVFFFPTNNANPTTTTRCPPSESRDVCFCKCEDVWQDLDIKCVPLHLSREARLDKPRLGGDLNRLLNTINWEPLITFSWVEFTQPGGHMRKIQDIGTCCSTNGPPEHWSSNSTITCNKELNMNIEIYTLSFRNQSRVPVDQSQLASYKIQVHGVDLTAKLYRVDSSTNNATVDFQDFVYLMKTKPYQSQLIAIHPSLRNKTLDEIQTTDFNLRRFLLEGTQSHDEDPNLRKGHGSDGVQKEDSPLEGKQSNNKGNQGSNAKRDDRARMSLLLLMIIYYFH